jgi:signal transduction histidine kinase
MTQMPSIPLPASGARPALTRALQALLALGPDDDRSAARVLAGIIAETDACAGLLRWPAQSGPCELQQGDLPDEGQQQWLSELPASGRLRRDGDTLCACAWAPADGCMLTLGWRNTPPSGVLAALAAEQAELAGLCHLLARLQDIREARHNILCVTRYQAMLAECMEWLNALDQPGPQEKFDEADVYHGLLRRVRVVSAASGAGLQLMRGNGEPFQWVDQEFPEQEALAALAWLPAGGNSVCLWDMPDPRGTLAVLRLDILTPQGLRARLYLRRRSEAGAHGFTRQDIANTQKLATLVFRTVEKIRLHEDLRLSNQFLAMEREDHQHLIAELRNTQQQLLHSEKLASLGQLAAGLAHEINNPVSFLSSNLNVLNQHFGSLQQVLARGEAEAARHGDPPLQQPADAAAQRAEIGEILEESRQGLDRVKQIVRDLRNFSRADDTSMQMADLHQCLDSTLSILRHELRHKVDLVKCYGDLPLVECAAGQVNQVLMNLLVNAAQAMDKPGRITVRTGQVNDRVFVQVEDNGSGIRPEHLNRIFDPFFTTKPVGVGTGLGLSLSYGIIQRHHGLIDVDSTPGEGTCFTVWLPVMQPDTRDGGQQPPSEDDTNDRNHQQDTAGR